MSKITKAVIPCGGMGTRFLPITKTLAKEMMPIIDTPVLSYIINEAADSGITDVLLIVNENKKDKKYNKKTGNFFACSKCQSKRKKKIS